MYIYQKNFTYCTYKSKQFSRFEEESAKRLEQNQRCLFLGNAAMQWLDIRLQLIGVAVVTGLGVIAVIQHQFHSVDPGETGLSLVAVQTFAVIAAVAVQ